MNKGFFIGVIVFVAAITFTAAHWLGYKHGREFERERAVECGAAYYIPMDDGTTRLIWRGSYKKGPYKGQTIETSWDD
jgi:hypothetical protein